MSALTVVRPIDPATPGYRVSQLWGQLEGRAWGVRNPLGVGGHPGVDYAVARGVPIRAAADFVCIYAGPASGFGDHAVALWHPALGVATTYGHAMAHYVGYGQTGLAGQHVADVDSEGQSTGNHLHFEVRPDDQPFGGNPPNIDGEAWLQLHLAQNGNALPALTAADRAHILRMQQLLGVGADGSWGKSTDNAYQTLRWKLLTPPNKLVKSAIVQGVQRDVFGFARADQDGVYGPKTDKAWQLARLCWLNK